MPSQEHRQSDYGHPMSHRRGWDNIYGTSRQFRDRLHSIYYSNYNIRQYFHELDFKHQMLQLTANSLLHQVNLLQVVCIQEPHICSFVFLKRN